MPYKIHPYSFRKAKELGVVIKPSSNKLKKIDVFKNNQKITSVGAIGYKDFPTYLELEKKGLIPKGTANKRRNLYKIRHMNNRKIKNTAGYYADQLLW